MGTDWQTALEEAEASREELRRENARLGAAMHGDAKIVAELRAENARLREMVLALLCKMGEAARSKADGTIFIVGNPDTLVPAALWERIAGQDWGDLTDAACDLLKSNQPLPLRGGGAAGPPSPEPSSAQPGGGRDSGSIAGALGAQFCIECGADIDHEGDREVQLTAAGAAHLGEARR